MPNRWYCTVMIIGDKSWENKTGFFHHKLESAQRFLSTGMKAEWLANEKARQAIIPMDGTRAGDPHDLPKSWNGGSMRWRGEEDIKVMQDLCENKPVQGINEQ